MVSFDRKSLPSIEEQFSILSGPGILPGITLGDWLKLLRENRFRIHPYYLSRAASITGTAIMNSLARWYEDWRYSSSVAEMQIASPLFVLGHWRSGTTFLHNLLGLDNHFAYPTLYQTMYPNTFLSTEKYGSRLLRLLMSKHRPQDDIRLDPSVAWEDEFVMCACGFRTPYLTWVFPCQANYYNQFLTFRDTPQDEVNYWRSSLKWFLQKLTLKHGKSLILKSPTHTCRIRFLLEMSPDAKFVHIHRNPYAVFQSSVHMHVKVLPKCRLQAPTSWMWFSGSAPIRGRIRWLFRAAQLIPAGHFHEVSFEELEKEPVRQMRLLYQALGLSNFECAEPGLKRYLQSLAGYRKNVFPELEPALRQQIGSRWRKCFEEWAYAV